MAEEHFKLYALGHDLYNDDNGPCQTCGKLWSKHNGIACPIHDRPYEYKWEGPGFIPSIGPLKHTPIVCDEHGIPLDPQPAPFKKEESTDPRILTLHSFKNGSQKFEGLISAGPYCRMSSDAHTLVYDVSSLIRNPWGFPGMRTKTGKDPEVQAILQKCRKGYKKIYTQIEYLVNSWQPHDLWIGCGNGRLQSVGVVEMALSQLQKKYDGTGIDLGYPKIEFRVDHHNI